VLFRSTDLRLLDHEPLVTAHARYAHVLHLFVFDPRWYGVSRVARLPRVGPHRARFLLDAVADLRRSLRARGTELVLRTGAVEEVVPAIAAAVSATAVLAHNEVGVEERAADAALRRALGRISASAGVPSSGGGSGVRLELVWGGATLYHVEDLPFGGAPAALPDVYTAFRRSVEASARVRQPLPVPTCLRPAPPGPWDAAAAADPPPFPLAGALVARGANAGAGLRPSPAALGAADLAPLFAALGVPAPAPAARAGGARPGGGGGAPPSAPSAAAAASAAPFAAAAAGLAPVAGTLADGEPAIIATGLGDLPSSQPPLVGGEGPGLARIDAWVLRGDALRTYKETRNGLLGADFSSKLSPWLAHGCVSARTVAAAVAQHERERGPGGANESTYWLLFELLWRDYMRLYARKHGPALFAVGGPSARGAKATAAPGGAAAASTARWPRDRAQEAAWALGRTGFPFVDAAMRELLATGFTSNRARQNVASFLARDVGVDWRVGAEWFEATLVDHDVASNWGNWTYVAGVGADPREDRYFLIPKQARDYDPRGEFMRTWLPELLGTPADALADPRRLPPETLRATGYPPMVCQLLAWRKPRDPAEGARGGVGAAGEGAGGGRGGGGGRRSDASGGKGGQRPGRGRGGHPAAAAAAVGR